MAAVDFPSSPALNDVFTSGALSWKWNGSAWAPQNPTTLAGYGITDAASLSANNFTGIQSAPNYTANAVSGAGYAFFASNATTHGIYMANYADTNGGRLDSTSDFNLYYKISSGTNRGHVFKGNSGAVVQITGGGQIYVSPTSSGTAPFVLSSNATAVVANLNADKLDGLDSTAFALVGSGNSLTGNQTATGYFRSSATGEAFGITAGTTTSDSFMSMRNSSGNERWRFGIDGDGTSNLQIERFNSSGVYVDKPFSISVSDGSLDLVLKNGAWYNGADAVGRLYFTASGANYYKSANGTHEFRNAADAARFTIDTSGNVTMVGKLTTVASTTSAAGIIIPHGTAPTVPTNGDLWTTTTAALVRINGATKTFAFTDSSITGSAATLTTGRTLAITGDLTWTSPSFDGSGNVTAAGTLATVNSNVGSFGSTSAVPIITVNAKGLITAVSTAALGTAAVQNTGTSGANIPFLNGTNTWSGVQTVAANLLLTGGGTYSEPATIAGVLSMDTVGGDFTISSRSNGGSTALSFRTSASGTGAERMRITSAGNVGIGTTSPSSLLHVLGSAYLGNVGTQGTLRLYSSAATGTGGYAYIQANNTNPGQLDFIGGQGNAATVNRFSFGGAMAPSADATYDLGLSGIGWRSLWVSGTNDSYIGGKLGIGNTSPGAKLHVVGSGIVVNTTGGAGTSIGRHINLGSVTTATDWRSYAGSTTAAIQMENSSTEGFLLVPTLGAAVPRTQFITTGGYEIQVGATIGSTGTTALQILSGGNVGIGTTSPGTKLDVVTPSASVFDGTNSATWNSVATIRNTTGGSGTNALINLYTGGANTNLVFGAVQNSSGYADFVFASYGVSFAERMRITSSGNVGIGTTAPTGALSVYRATSTSFLADAIQVHRPGVLASYGFMSYLPSSDTAVFGSVYSGGAKGQILLRVSDGTTHIDGLAVNASGNVGVGITSPLVKSHVYGTSAAPSGTAYNGVFMVHGTTTAQLEIGLQPASPYGGWLQMGDTTRTTQNYPILLQPVIGNVGIGMTTAPTAKFEVYDGSTGPDVFKITAPAGSSSGTVAQIRSGANSSGVKLFSIDYGASYANNALTVLANGNIGLGNTSPTYTLDVSGTVRGLSTASEYASLVATATAGYPSYLQLYRAGYENWYIGSPSNSTNLFISAGSAGSTAGITLLNTGLVGIGTTSPGSKLDVNGSTRVQGYNIPSTGTGMEMVYDSGLVAGRIFAIDRGGSVYKDLRLDGLNLILQASSGGNVGVGTTSPTAKFEVSGSSTQAAIGVVGSDPQNARIDIKNTASAGARTFSLRAGTTGVDYEGFTIYDSNAAATRFIITNAGNVGIGNSSPSARLTVAGDVYLSGATNKSIGFNSSTNWQYYLASSGDDFRLYDSDSVDFVKLFYNSGGTGKYASILSTLHVKNTGRVGIGTTNPQSKFVVSNGGSEGLEFYPGDAVGLTRVMSYNRNDSTYDDLALRGITIRFENDSGNEVMRTSGTNVGIGAGSPTARLTINGGSLASAGSDLNISANLTTGRLLGTGGGALNSLHTFTDSGGLELTAGSSAGYVSGIGIGARSFSGTSSDAVTIWTRSTERARIDSNGDLSLYGQLYQTNNAGLASTTTSGMVRVTSPGGGAYATTSSTQTGYIKITLPVSWNDTMMSFKVKVYDYSTQTSFLIELGGYAYAGGTSWYNTFANIIGAPHVNLNYNIRFGHDGTKCAIYIGEVGTVWNYPQIAVTDFQAGFSNYTAATWASGWAVSITTTLGTITQTVNGNQIGRLINGNAIWHAGNDGSGSGLDADTVDGYQASDFGKLASANLWSGTNVFTQSNALSLRSDSGYMDWYNSAQTARRGYIQHAGSYWYFNNEVSGGHISVSTTGGGLVYINGGTVWHSSNDGSGSGLDADLLDGNHGSYYTPKFIGLADAVNLNTVTDSGFYRFGATVVNGPSGASGYSNMLVNRGSDTMSQIYMNYNNADMWWRSGSTVSDGSWTTPSAWRKMWNDGNDGMGSGLDADIIRGVAFSNSDAGGPVAANSLNKNGISYVNSDISLYGQSDGALYSQAHSSDWQHQIFGDYRNGSIAVRGKNSGTWQAWRTVWDSGNDGAGSGLDADLLDGLNSTSFLRADTGNPLIRITSGNGNGVGFWDGSDSYKIWMSDATDGTWGGRVSGDSTSDYNMYFRMTGGTNRGFVFCGGSGGTTKIGGIDGAGNARFAGDVVAYASDARLKNNVTPIQNAREKLSLIGGYTFDWDIEKSASVNFFPANTHEHGVIAQEIEKVMPDAVTTSAFHPDYKTVKYDKLTSLLIAVAKEQEEEINMQKKSIEALEDKVNKLTEMVEALLGGKNGI